MTRPTRSKQWRAKYLLEQLQHAGYTLRAEGDRLVLVPASRHGPSLDADIERHHEELLRVVKAADEVTQRMKGNGNG